MQDPQSALAQDVWLCRWRAGAIAEDTMTRPQPPLAGHQGRRRSVSPFQPATRDTRHSPHQLGELTRLPGHDLVLEVGDRPVPHDPVNPDLSVSISSR